ncbi:MAG TPA: sigma-54 dependent transcriptional regulator [Sedimentisphaerales bacterium]|nr:sigma-54 dependent transcriptional regulator [Sedimentisphaerales bacterium]
MADNCAEALELVRAVNPDLVVFDDSTCSDTMRQFRNLADASLINVPTIIVANAHDNSLPPLETDASANMVRDWLRTQQHLGAPEKTAGDNAENNQPVQNQSHFFADDCAAEVSMAGRSQATLDTIKMIKLVAASACNPVLIVGETGTGKELAAKAVHNLRHTPKAPFIAINCAALTANLLESELFGHVKGSFTGADREKTGLLELAQAGTIFLDEISEMPLELQAKLLRLLQEKTFRKVGGTTEIQCKATIIASSNRDLNQLVQQNRFRQDLYYRLNICPVTVAALRSPARKSDIPLLAQYFLKTSEICPEKAGKITSLTNLAVQALNKYHWPGNVRQLRNIIERAVIMEKTNKIGLTSILIEPPETNDNLDNASAVNQAISDFSLAKAERELIARALCQTGWQKTRAAALLGITRATLYAKVNQYNLSKSPDEPQETPGDNCQCPVDESFAAIQ